MSLQLPRHATGGRGAIRRLLLLPVLGVSVVVLAGCGSENSDDWKQLAMPDPVTVQGKQTLDLWQGAWVAALVTGLVVWGLIFWVVVRYRRRSDDEIPIQTRYNLPLEIFYTIAPIMMVIVFFQQTVETQNVLLERTDDPDQIIEVTAQQWSWTFNHGVGEVDYAADEESADDEFPYAEYAYVAGTGSDIPTLVLPVGETIRFNLHSPDVIHNFGVPTFLFKMDVIPGRVNSFEITTKEEGFYAGKCFELCGVYHSRMLFNVDIVSPEKYDAYVETLVEEGQVSPTPLLGGEYADSQVGLDSGPEEDDSEGAQE
ncbi:cytochrome c oxidase subunit II [Nocardioides dongkuii]|uniref:aa3-type cytochrome oxidase subunit II n=1 Tax=Nocardioides dongkuii TaxID=2760089 RepID=UPI0015FD3C5E|nr:cytochrome c oxidase subunit II [Nocardioides dongkuii]